MQPPERPIYNKLNITKMRVFQCLLGVDARHAGGSGAYVLYIIHIFSYRTLVNFESKSQVSSIYNIVLSGSRWCTTLVILNKAKPFIILFEEQRDTATLTKS